MFDFYLYRPHARGWYRLTNQQAPDYRTAARRAAFSSGVKRVKVEPADAAAAASMGYKSHIVNFK